MLLKEKSSIDSIGTGAPWRPLLWYRLAHHQLMMQRKYPGNPKKVWEELLREHDRVTGRRRGSVASSRLESLAEHLSAGDIPIDADRVEVGAN